MVYEDKLALIGTHSAVDVAREPYVTADVLIPAYFEQISARLVLDGFAFGNIFSAPPAKKHLSSP